MLVRASTESWQCVSVCTQLVKATEEERRTGSVVGCGCRRVCCACVCCVCVGKRRVCDAVGKTRRTRDYPTTRGSSFAWNAPDGPTVGSIAREDGVCVRVGVSESESEGEGEIER